MSLDWLELCVSLAACQFYRRETREPEKYVGEQVRGMSSSLSVQLLVMADAVGMWKANHVFGSSTVRTSRYGCYNRMCGVTLTVKTEQQTALHSRRISFGAYM
jgi:hypothetical protein